MCTYDDCPTPGRRDVLKAGAALLAVGLTTGFARAAAPLGDTVHFPSAAGDAAGYLALPKDTAAAPAILVTHGEIGVPESQRLVADELAEAGFCALVMQRFSRIPGFGWEQIAIRKGYYDHGVTNAVVMKKGSW